jgi:hypothetical protein
MAMTNAQEQIVRGRGKQEHRCSRAAQSGPELSLSSSTHAPHELELPGGSNLGTYNDDAFTRALLADAIKRCGKSREQIAGHMSYLLATKITSEMLNRFTGESKQAQGFPFAWARAFCAATDDWRLIQHLAEQAGFLLLDRDDADVLSLGELAVEQQRARREIERHANNIIARRAGV